MRVTGDRHDSAFLGLQRVSDGRPVDITVNPGYTLITAEQGSSACARS